MRDTFPGAFSGVTNGNLELVLRRGFKSLIYIYIPVALIARNELLLAVTFLRLLDCEPILCYTTN